MFGNRFAHEDGKAVISAVNWQEPKESVTSDYPLLLTTGRVMHLYLSSVQTRNSPKLNCHYSEPLLAIHPEIASKHHIENGMLVKVQSKRGSAVMRAALTPGIRKDTLFTSFHWGDLQSINRVTNPALDPLSRMPKFKICAVVISALKSVGGILNDIKSDTKEKFRRAISWVYSEIKEKSEVIKNQRRGYAQTARAEAFFRPALNRFMFKIAVLVRGQGKFKRFILR